MSDKIFASNLILNVKKSMSNLIKHQGYSFQNKKNPSITNIINIPLI